MTKKYMLLYGKKSVRERLKVNPKSIRKIFLKNDFKSYEIENLIKSKHVNCEYLPARKIENMKRAKNVQGIVARVDSFKTFDFDELLQQTCNDKSTIVFLDRINDPHNLGVIIRCLACFGKFAVVIPEIGACSITETVMHVSSGGENYVPVCVVKQLPEAINKAKKLGLFMIGAVIDKKSKTLANIKLRFPLGLVLGAEISGISLEVLKCLDDKVHILMPGAGLSLNVSMACAILSHEIVSKRQINKQ